MNISIVVGSQSSQFVHTLKINAYVIIARVQRDLNDTAYIITLKSVCRTYKILTGLELVKAFPYGLAVRIPGFHPGGPGSTPGMGITVVFFFFLQRWNITQNN